MINLFMNFLPWACLKQVCQAVQQAEPTPQFECILPDAQIFTQQRRSLP
jgi:hypothetical protein